LVKLCKLNVSFLLLGIICLVGSCRIDIIGFLMSNDLSVRLKERKNYKFLKDKNWMVTSIGNDGYSFIVIADTHIENRNDFGLMEKLKDIIDNDSEIKFVVFSGDITQKGLETEINKFIEIANYVGVPCYPVIGNHDIFAGNWREWKTQIGSTCYMIDGGGTSLFILDSANAFFGKVQLDWLERELKKVPHDNKVFVFTHTNLFIKSLVDVQQFTDTKERARVIYLLRGRCDAMFTGHLHKEVVREAGGVPYISIESFREQGTYCRVSVEAGGIKYKTIRF